MSQIKDNYLLLRLLQSNRRKLEQLLGEEWPAFLKLLGSVLGSFLGSTPTGGLGETLREVIDRVTRDLTEPASDILRDVVKSVPAGKTPPKGEIQVALPDSRTVVLSVPGDISRRGIARADVEREAERMMREMVGVQSAARPTRSELPGLPLQLPPDPGPSVYDVQPPQEPDPCTKSPAAYPIDEWAGDPSRGPFKTGTEVWGDSERALAWKGFDPGVDFLNPAAYPSGALPVPEPEPQSVPESAAPPSPPLPLSPAERRINIWIAEREQERSRPLRLGEPYSLRFQFAQPRASSLVSGPQTLIPQADIPDAGLETEWVVTSSEVEMTSGSPEVQVTSTSDPAIWTARFALRISLQGDSDTRTVTIRPHSGPALMSVAVFAHFAGGRRELYRELALKLAVEVGEDGTPTVRVEEEQVTEARHLGLRTTHEWTTPPGRLSITVPKAAPVVLVDASYGAEEIDNEEILPPWDVKKLAGRINNVRASAEKFRGKWESYLNDIDGASLAERLQDYTQSPEYDWSQLQDLADPARQAAWDQVKVSSELRDMAVDGHALYQALFPKGTDLRGWVDALPPGARLEISWKDGEVSNIPWGLMCRQPAPPPGGAVEATDFLGLRYRIAYTTHKASDRSKALGAPAAVHQASFLYWGDHPADTAGTEARWQRNLWAGLPNQVIIPAASSADRRGDLVRLWNDPDPSPMAILYFFCQCKVGDGNDPVLSFGDSAADILRRTDLAGQDLDDRPFVFANACTTASADPYIANELEATFFERGCRAFLGTETKVPIPLAARFASIFFDFFYRRVDPAPMAAGEALAQSRLFLWTRYRNIGGLFYTYINQYELFLADDAEVAALRA
jgi:hypothetical protein